MAGGVKQLVGDINNDGKIDIVDAKLALSATIENINLTEDELKRADINNDGNVSIADARSILQHVVGKKLIVEVIE